MSPPRPILKRTPSSSNTPTHAVHFPPTATLTCTFSVYSPTIYDRSPIVVTPNSCALPERGCPGRTYTDETAAGCNSSGGLPTSTRKGQPLNGRVLHPRAFSYPLSLRNEDSSTDAEYDQPQRTPTLMFPFLPTLIPDMSSESEESDGFACTPTDQPIHMSYSMNQRHGLPIPDTSLSIPYPRVPEIRLINPNEYFSYSSYPPRTPTALSFLPHPPSPRNETHYPTSEEEAVEKPRCPRFRRRDRSRDRDRIRIDHERPESVTVVTPPSTPKCSPNSKKANKYAMYKTQLANTSSSCFSFQDQDSGCLGGF